MLQRWKRYGRTATFYDGLVRVGSGPMLGLVQKIAGWRLKHGNYKLPIEQKAFDLYVRLTGQTGRGAEKLDKDLGRDPPHPVQS